MFDEFTQNSIKTIMLAQEEARRMGHNYVDTEQLLLGLVGEGTGIAFQALKANGVSLKSARIIVQEKIGKGEDVVLPWYLWWKYFFIHSSKEMPFKARAKKVLELSLEEAKALDHPFIGTEHLLLGLTREAMDSLATGETSGIAFQVLQKLGVDLEVLRKQIFELIAKREQ